MKTLLHTLKAAFLPIFFATLTCAEAQTTPISTYAGLTAALASGVATNFAAATVIQYSTSQQTLQITQNTIIDGGTNNVILDASSSTRLFVVHTNCVLTLANLQLRHGLGGNGGAILNSGQLIVSNCIFFENTATNLNGALGTAGTSTNAPDGTAGGAGGNIMGGAIYSYGPLFIYNSLFETNSAIAGNGGNGGAGFGTTGQVFAGSGGNGGNGGNAYGGAIYSTGSNNVIYATEFLGDYCYGGDGGNGGAAGAAQFLNYSGASAQGGTGGAAYGGAVFMGGSLVASNCTFVSDDAVGGTSKAAAFAFNGAGFNAANGGNGLGGGLYVTTASAKVDLENSVFYGNICGGGGGGSAAGTGTISGNGGAAIGGGGYIGAVATTIRNCTLATNLLFGGTNGAATGTNSFDGTVGEMAGWDVFRSAGTIKMANSIVAGKSGSVNGVTDAGYNLCSDGSLTKLLATTRVSINPQLDSGVSYQGPPLGPKGINGQALLTMAVLAGPATNAIPGIPGITFPATDGRLLARGTPATIGAFETRTITVTNTAPATIITEPQNQIAVIGNPATLSVNALTNANDPNPLGYQWTLNGVNLTQGGNFDGVNGPTLQIKSVAAASLGAYQVIISPSVLDSVTNSVVAYLNVNIPTTIQAQPVSKLNAPDGSVVTFKVKVSGSPPFYYQWRSNGVPLVDGGEFSGSLTTNLTINPATFSDVASYTVVVTNFYRTITSAVARLTIVTDKAKPSVVITAPKANARTTTNAIYGTTTDNAQVTSVNCWITNIVAGVTNVTFTNAIVSTTGTTAKTWGVTNVFAAGTNIVAVQAVDYSGNVSAVVSRKFFYVVPSFFSLSLYGPGNVIAKPPFAGAFAPTNGATLQIGQGYTLTASPNPNCLLTNWKSAGFTVYSNTLHFTMTPNLAIQANFIISPFLAVAGGYNGLFFETNEVNPATAGMLSGLAVGKVGTYSGKLLLGAATYPVSGTFNVFGQASNYIARAAAKGGPLGLAMGVDLSNGALTGAVSGLSSNWVAPLNGEQNAPTTGAASFESTLLLSASTNGVGDVPPGFGYVLMTNRAGAVTLTGALPDGTAFTQAAPLGIFGDLPLYGRLYGQAGLVIGWVTLTNATPEVPNGIFWTRPAMKSTFYPAGFTNVLAGQGSQWTNDPTYAGAATLTISNSSTNASYPISISKGVIASATAPTAVKGSVNTKTGLVKLTFPSGIKSGTVAGSGAILQSSNSLGGNFVTKTNAGVISWQP